MKNDVNAADGEFGRSPGDGTGRVADGPDGECGCPGPPPKFRLPPPPRPPSVFDSDCSENSTSRSEICKAVPVIDAERRQGPPVPYLAIVLIAAVAVAVFLLIGIYLVLIKRRKMQQNLFPRKSSSQNRCDSASANGVVYEDLTSLRPRTLSSNCPPGQTTLPSIEMIDATSLSERGTFVHAAPPAQDLFEPQELFNPVYEELSNASAEGGETDSEGLPPATMSEDEFAEDELSLAGEGGDLRRREGDNPDDRYSRRCVGGDACREVDSSDADDRCIFLENRNLSADRVFKGRCRGPHFRSAGKRPKSLDRRKVWRNKAPAPPSLPPADRNEFHEGFLLKRILQIYPDVTGVGLQFARRLPTVRQSLEKPVSAGRGESFDAFGRGLELPCHKPEIFSTVGQVRGFTKNQSLDSSLGSDSGYSNNFSGDKSSSKLRREYRPGANRGDNVVPS